MVSLSVISHLNAVKGSAFGFWFCVFGAEDGLLNYGTFLSVWVSARLFFSSLQTPCHYDFMNNVMCPSVFIINPTSIFSPWFYGHISSVHKLSKTFAEFALVYCITQCWLGGYCIWRFYALYWGSICGSFYFLKEAVLFIHV